MALTPAMETALEADSFRMFGALKIELNNGDTIRLLDASGIVRVGSEVYTGYDETYGALGGLEAVVDGVDAEAPRLALSLLVPSAAAAMALRAGDQQGSPISLIEGLVGPDGVAIEDPDVAFVGELDTAFRALGDGRNVVDMDFVSIFERFFEVDEGVRLSDGWLQSIFPGAKGLDQVTGLGQKLPWGVGGGGSAFKGTRSRDWNWWSGSPLSATLAPPASSRGLINSLFGGSAGRDAAGMLF